MNPDLKEKLIKAKSGDEQAFRFLFNSFKNDIFIYIRSIIKNKEDCEDLLLETFLKAFKNIERFNVEYSFKKWIIRIAHNTCIDFIRKKRLSTISIEQQNSSNEEIFEIPLIDPFSSPDRVLKQKIIRKKIKKEIDLLPESYKLIVELRYLHQKTYEEIAQELNIPIGTVKTKIFRAREILREKFAGLF